MSAPIAAEVLREFGAEVRRFKSAKGAVRWFDAYSARQLRVNRDLSDFGASASRARVEQNRATYAALLLCFRRRDPGVDDEDMGTLLGATLDYILGEYSLAYLAERHGLSELGFTRWVERGEGVLKRRLLARRLLLVEHCECGCGVEQLQEAA